jgi:hypothetical protein
MWSCLLPAVAMSATVLITFESDAEAIQLGFPENTRLSVGAAPLVLNQSIYDCNFGPQGELACAWMLRTPPPTPSPTPTTVNLGLRPGPISLI